MSSRNGHPLIAANISCVPQRSPFRYPGGKSWLIPQIRQWLSAYCNRRVHLIEPFAGGASVTLTAVMEGFVPNATMVELDASVAAVWRVILGPKGPTLEKLIRESMFEDCEILQKLQTKPDRLFDRAFQTLLRNRVARNGILADGAGLLKNGEAGQGLRSRWYPETLARRIREIIEVKDRLRFEHDDGLKFIVGNKNSSKTLFFVDPPYAGISERLYRHNSIDHAALFGQLSEIRGDFLMTYNDDRTVRDLAAKHSLQVRRIRMRCGQSRFKDELLIGRNLDWLNERYVQPYSNNSNTAVRKSSHGYSFPGVGLVQKAVKRQLILTNSARRRQ